MVLFFIKDMNALKSLLIFGIFFLISCQKADFESDAYPDPPEGNEISLCESFPSMVDSLAFTSDGQKLYATDSESSRVLVISPAKGKVVKIIQTFGPTRGILVSPDDKRVYVVTQESGQLTVIDTKTDQIIKTYDLDVPHPHDLALKPDGTVAYVSSSIPLNISVIDLTDEKPVYTIPFDQYFVTQNGLKRNPLEPTSGYHFLIPNYFVNYLGTVYAAIGGHSFKNDGYVAFYDLARKNLIKRIHLSGTPVWSYFSPDGKQLFVKMFESKTERKGHTNLVTSEPFLVVVDTEVYKIDKIVPIEKPFGKGAFSPDGRLFYFVEAEFVSHQEKREFSISLVRVNTNTLKEVDKITVPVPEELPNMRCN